MLKILSIIIILGLLSCESNRNKKYTGFYLPYKIDLHQGNELTSSDLAKLNIGLYKQQVEEIIGSPMLIDTFDRDLWIYYNLQNTRKGKSVRRKISLYFANEKLIKIDTE